ncbi:MAG: hypothetical protein COA96_02825 [SAR86 cluster bacterium]|uniref:Uncharacterized protein n=1 Tax=SAR86 cluster bacterium TaxID=2030880 RepID=A0A2A5B8Z4_9GAMM|nr:MAG: hypothetical protein COA96_02825 [SAR86 cluster bacterium]
MLLLVSAPSSFAHEQKTAVTRILFNPNTGNIEVMHRFLVHDAEHAAGVIFGAGQKLLESADSRALFGSYVVNRFSIATIDENQKSTELDLAYIGEEIDGQFLWVYQEAKIFDGMQALRVVNMALRDVWPDQANLVNIEKDGQIYSLSFIGSSESLLIEL